MPDVMACAAACGATAEVQWRRRSAEDVTHTDAVYACRLHAIELEAAGRVHQAACTAPNLAQLPACDCTPEVPPHDPDPAGPTVTLATGWVISATPTT